MNDTIRRCTMCETPLDLPNRPWTIDCGGDCFACMAECGDPDAIRELTKPWEPLVFGEPLKKETTASTPADGARAEGRIKLPGGLHIARLPADDDFWLFDGSQPLYYLGEETAQEFAALAAPAAGVAHALVPREPTAEMVEAGVIPGLVHGLTVSAMWSDMIDAAPQISAAPPAAPAGDVAVLRAALERIERWKGEFPATGHYWDDRADKTPDNEMSYAAVWGSNGERDYMRKVARDALEQASRPAPAPPAGRAPAGAEGQIVHDLAQEYEHRDPDHTPTDAERAMLEDFGNALLEQLDALRGGGARGGVSAELRALSEAATPDWSVSTKGGRGVSYIIGPSTNDAISSPDVILSAAYSDRSIPDDDANIRFACAAVADVRARIEAEGRPGRAGGEATP